MIARLVAHAKSWLGRTAIKEAARSEAAFCAAYERYSAAVKAGDTRAMHQAWGPLRDARTAQLVREIKPSKHPSIVSRIATNDELRAPSAWRGTR